MLLFGLPFHQPPAFVKDGFQHDTAFFGWHPFGGLIKGKPKVGQAVSEIFLELALHFEVD